MDADTDVAHAPYIVVRMTGGEIADDKSPQTVEFSLIICAYDTGIERAGFRMSPTSRRTSCRERAPRRTSAEPSPS